MTIHRDGGFRWLAIFKDDHEPAHVHLSGDGEAKVNLIGLDGRPALVWNVGMSKGDLRRAQRIVADRQAVFVAHWGDIHG